MRLLGCERSRLLRSSLSQYLAADSSDAFHTARQTSGRSGEPQSVELRLAGGGEEALAVAERHAGPIELLLTDVLMPGMDGRALAAKLREALDAG